MIPSFENQLFSSDLGARQLFLSSTFNSGGNGVSWAERSGQAEGIDASYFQGLQERWRFYLLYTLSCVLTAKAVPTP